MPDAMYEVPVEVLHELRERRVRAGRLEEALRAALACLRARDLVGNDIDRAREKARLAFSSHKAADDA
jgi:hypothetical protein